MISTQSGIHIPVMLDEVIDALAPAKDKLFIDATFGNGGYSEALLKAANCHVVAIDRDPDAILRGKTLCNAFGERLSLHESNFSQIDTLIVDQNYPQPDGIVFDLGVCSIQLEDAARGFSFRHDGPLDMRMSKQGQDASEIVNEFDEQRLADILWRYGEERASRRIARAIIRARLDARIERTTQLADIIHAVMPRPKPGGADSATRSFQALRIFINGELDELETALEASEKLLKPGGILAVVSFHSLEDRLVKTFLTSRSKTHSGTSRHRPDIATTPTFRLSPAKAISPSQDEITHNPRARSAKLRTAIRLSTSERPSTSKRKALS